MPVVSKIEDCIIIGGGNSIKKAFSLGLGLRLQGKLVIACNYAFRHFEHTFLTFIDRDFYYPSQNAIVNKTHPNIYEELKTLPLIIGRNINGVEEFKLPNTILLNGNSVTYYREQALKKGFYTGNLTGIFALSLATFLMNYNGIIYLLGFDWNRRKSEEVDRKNYSGQTDLQIHYYSKEEINHQGCGKIGYYENHNPDNCFKPFIKERDVKIYNVSLESNINCFEKISYEKMFTLLNKETYNQEELRKETKLMFTNK